MLQLVVKIAITAALVVAISEVARRSALVGAIIASLPVVSILAMTWLWLDERDAGKVADLATGTLWLVLPSLVLFVVLPLLLRRNVGYFVALGIASGATIAAYGVTLLVLARFGVKS